MADVELPSSSLDLDRRDWSNWCSQAVGSVQTYYLHFGKQQGNSGPAARHLELVRWQGCVVEFEEGRWLEGA